MLRSNRFENCTIDCIGRPLDDPKLLEMKRSFWKHCLRIDSDVVSGGVEPSFLLPPLDFLGNDDETRLAFFREMDMTRDRKLDFASKIFSRMRKRFEVASLSEHADSVRSRSTASHNISLSHQVGT